MTCKTECTQFDLAMELLIENGFEGLAETVGLLMNTAMQVERSRHLKITATNKISIDRAAIREARRYDGKWVLETNDDTITVEDAAKGYKGLMIIERCFRSLKRTQIRMTPMFHWAPRRIETHVKICVLSLLIERVAELACSKPWSQIRRALEKLQASEFENSNHNFFKLNEVDSDVRDVLETLGIPLPASILSISSTEKKG